MLKSLTDPKINYISVKLSGIYAQINPLNYENCNENCKKELCDLMGNIYGQAKKYPDVDKQGNKRYKFVNLDMEEYKDAELTLDVFLSVMSEERFKDLTAGVVIQAYLPDAVIQAYLPDAELLYDRLVAFAKKRYADGGAPLKVRLVKGANLQMETKGANLQMETIVSSIKDWENPVLDSKVEVDANYLHLLDKALLKENAEALNIGVASHNFFTIGYANLLSENNGSEDYISFEINGSEDYISFEMLEGMANHLPRVMRKLQKKIILYTPVVSDEHFLFRIWLEEWTKIQEKITF